jgi:hypothetical protein
MGCSSYLKAPDPADSSQQLFLQFQYGFRREIEYDLGDDIHWETDELAADFDTQTDALVPAWQMQGPRHFAVTVKANKIVSLSEISAVEADRMLEEQFTGDSRHIWKK